MARAKVTKPSAQDAQPSATASGAHPSQPAPSNAQSPSTVPAVLVPRNMLRAELESRSPKSLTQGAKSPTAKLLRCLKPQRTPQALPHCSTRVSQVFDMPQVV
ncbi:hypothetical protein GGF50DRAFT_119797 [Schizophyllum commune]